MKTTIKTLCFFIIILAWLNQVNACKAFECKTDSECYQEYLIETKTWFYSNYYYNGNTHKIDMPETRLDFIRLEYKYITWQLNKNDRYFNTVRLNIALIKRGLEPLYY